MSSETDDRGTGSDPTGDDGGKGYHDQDSEPTMNAPEEGRPDGLAALKDDDDSDGAASEEPRGDID